MVFATGGNRRAADYAGIDTDKVRFWSLRLQRRLRLARRPDLHRLFPLVQSVGRAAARARRDRRGDHRRRLRSSAATARSSAPWPGAAVITLLRALLSLQIILPDGTSLIMPQHWVNVFIGLILIVAVLGDIWLRQEGLLARTRATACAGRTGGPACDDRRPAARRHARHPEELRRRPRAGRRRSAARSRRDPGPGRRQLGRQVDADEDHDRRLSARRGRGPGRGRSRPTSRARTRAAKSGSR